MKLWYKVLIGAAVGVFIGLVFPSGNDDITGFFGALSSIITNLGTYVLFPLILFQIMISTYENRHNHTAMRLFVRGTLVVIASSLALAVIGAASVAFLPLERIPVPAEEAPALEIPGLGTLLRNIVSENSLQTLTGDSGFLLGAFVFAVVVGLALYAQRSAAKPVIEFGEGAAKIFQHINIVVCDVLAFAVAVCAGSRLIAIRGIEDLGLFGQVFLLLFVLTVLIVFAAYPLILYFVGKRHRPFAWLKALLTAAIPAAFSGSNYLAMGFQIRLGSEDLRVSKRIWQWMVPYASIVSRGGTALVTSVAFLLIIHSHSKIEISFLQFIQVVGSATFISLVLGTVSGSGLMVGLALLSKWYGLGLEQGFLILQAAIPVLVSFAVFLDVATQSFITYLMHILSVRDHSEEQQPASFRFKDDFTIT